MRFDSNGTAIAWTEEGSGSPVVLIHGFGSSGRSFWGDTGIGADLARDFSVISIDARGHGKSDKPHDPSDYGAEMALDVVRLLDYLGLDAAHVVGYSMGAHITMCLLTLRPERVLSATLGGAGGRLRWASNGTNYEKEAAEIERGSCRTIIMRLGADRPPPSDEEIQAMSAAALEGNDRIALAAVRRAAAAQSVERDQVARIGVPVLGVVGTLDPYVQELRALKEVLPSLRLVEIDGADHGSCATHPAFVQNVRDHIQGSLSST